MTPRRLLPLLALLALGAAGCGGAVTPSTPSATAAASPPVHHVRTLPKRTFVRRANAICARYGHRIGSASHDRARLTRAHRVARTMRRQLARLGQPSHDRARWVRVMSKLQAVERHLDETRAALWSHSTPMVTLAARQADAASASLNRRARKFGMRACTAA